MSLSSVSESVNDEVMVINRELEEILKKHSSRVKIVGIGGAGGNTLSRMREVGIKGMEFIAANTDAQDLLYTNADRKILLGKQVAKGLGAGSNPQVGMDSAKEAAQEIKMKLDGADMIFITCGLGGGTGSGAAPVIAEIARSIGALTIGVVTLPFEAEGHKRIENAVQSLEKLEPLVDTLIVIPNDKLLELSPDLPLTNAFRIADEILTNAVKGITELVTKSGLVNLDFADLRTVMTRGGLSVIGTGESSDKENRAQGAVDRAIHNPLLDVDTSKASGALIHVVGGSDLTLEEYGKIMSYVGEKISPEAKLISGAQIINELRGVVKVMVIITGISSSYIINMKASVKTKTDTPRSSPDAGPFE